MAILRVLHNKDNPYVILNKKILEIESLSWEAKGLWSYLMSRPNDWRINVKHLHLNFPGGKDRILRLLKELIEHGFCKRVQQKNIDGRWLKGDYFVSDSIDELKKCLPEPCFPVPDNAATYKVLTSLSNKERNNNKERSAAAVSEENIEEVLRRRLKPDQVKRAMVFLDRFSAKRIEKIESLPAYLIDAIKNNYDKEDGSPEKYLDKNPQEKNLDLAKKIQKIIQLEKLNLKIHVNKEYVEFSEGMWSQNIETSSSPAHFLAEMKRLLKKTGMLGKIKKHL